VAKLYKYFHVVYSAPEDIWQLQIEGESDIFFQDKNKVFVINKAREIAAKDKAWQRKIVIHKRNNEQESIITYDRG
jgi:D-hexose-6-phosphate mutarotase